VLFSTIRDEIITEVGGDTSDSTLQTLVLGFIKSALRRFPRHTRSRFLLATKSVTLSAGSYYAALPAGFIRELAVYYLSDGGRKDIPKTDNYNEQFNSTTTSAPSGYRIFGSNIEFLHSADQTYTIYIECSAEIDDVVAGDSFTGDSSIVEILKDGAKSYYFDYSEDYPKASEKLGMFKAGLDKLEVDFLSDELPDYIEES
jgi:hypothetical protein